MNLGLIKPKARHGLIFEYKGGAYTIKDKKNPLGSQTGSISFLLNA